MTLPLPLLITRPLPGNVQELIWRELRRHGSGSDAVSIEVNPSDERLAPDALRERIRGKAGVLTTPRDRVDESVLEAAGPTLRVVSNYATGTDNIDLAACAARGVRVGNTPDAVVEPTADIAWLLILAAARRAHEGNALVRSGAWQGVSPNELNGVRLVGKTLLIVGAGRIGLATARRSLGWGMRLLHAARKRHPEFESAPLHSRHVDLDEGLRLADVVSIHTPLTVETRHLIDARRLSLLKPSAILVNTSRGAVVDEAALVRVLQQGQLFAAGLDVFEQEPNLAAGLRELPNLFTMPHLGSSTDEDRVWMTEQAVANLVAGVLGRELPTEVSAREGSESTAGR